MLALISKISGFSDLDFDWWARSQVPIITVITSSFLENIVRSSSNEPFFSIHFPITFDYILRIPWNLAWLFVEHPWLEFWVRDHVRDFFEVIWKYRIIERSQIYKLSSLIVIDANRVSYKNSSRWASISSFDRTYCLLLAFTHNIQIQIFNPFWERSIIVFLNNLLEIDPKIKVLFVFDR